MKVIELKRELDERFVSIDARFASIDARFADIDARFVGIDARFTEVERRIAAEGEATRRHFDVVAEGMRSEFSVVLDRLVATTDALAAMNATNAKEHARFDGTLANHEVRLGALERKRR